MWRKKSRAQLCGWVSLIKAKISPSPTPNILKRNMPIQMLSSVRKVLYKTQLIFLIIKEHKNFLSSDIGGFDKCSCQSDYI